MAKKINIEQKLKSIMERVIQENCNFEDFGYIESDKNGDSILVQTSKYCDGRYFVNSGYTTLSRHIDKLLREDYEYTFYELKKEYPKKDDDEISEMMNEIEESSAVYFTIKLHYFTDEGKGLAELVVEESNFYSDVINEKDSVYEKWFNGLNKKDIEKALKEVCKEYNSINFSIKEGNKTNMSIKDKKGAYEFKNSNLRFHGMKMDINGNPCFVLSTPNQRAFSVQQPYSITIHWSTKNGNSKESGIEIVEKNTKGNPFKSEEEFESYVLDLAKDRKHVKVYGNNFACGKGNFSSKDAERKFAWYKYSKKYQTNDNYTDYGLVCLERQKSHRGTYYVGIEVSIPNDPQKEDFTYQPHFEVERPSDLAHNGVKVQPDKRMLKIEKWLSKNQFSIVEDTKDVLRAGGKLAGNVVKDTLYNGGILMF
jgi:hypothetical protein